MYAYDFGKRRKEPCGDCDERGHCTMNCSPPAPSPAANENPTAISVGRLRAEAEKAKGAVAKKSRWE